MSGQLTDAPIIELEDDWERINAWFLEHDLTDGLPIVPPTEARVAAVPLRPCPSGQPPNASMPITRIASPTIMPANAERRIR